MFEDVKKQTSPAPSGEEPQESKPSLSPPPQEKIEDIFAEADGAEAKVPFSAKPVNQELEKPPVFQPKASVPVAEEKMGGGQKKDNLKKLLILGSGALGVLILLGGVWYGYVKFFKGAGSNVPSDLIKQKEEPASEEEEEGSAPVPPEEESQPAVEQPLDSDQDGLTDEEEKQLGIDSNKVDTDDDGLFDREEVMVYKTDPLNPDTDGDGYLDGDEVRNGYNPKGAGKLFEVK